MRRFANVNRDAVFQKAQLLQTLTFFERGLRQVYKLVERGFAISVQPEMLKVRRARVVAIEDGSAIRVEKA